MIKFTFKENGITTTKEFEKYYEMLRFVATSRIKDEDFISLQFGDNEDSKVINGIDGLVNEALTTADKMEEAERMFEAMVDDEDFFSDEEENIN